MVQVRSAGFMKLFGLTPNPNLKYGIEADDIKELLSKIPKEKRYVVRSSFQRSGSLSPLDPILVNGVPIQAYDGILTKLQPSDKVLVVQKVRAVPEIWTILTFLFKAYRVIKFLLWLDRFIRDKEKRTQQINKTLNDTIPLRRKFSSLSFKRCDCCHKKRLYLIAYEGNHKIYSCTNCRLFNKVEKKKIEAIRFPKEKFFNYEDVFEKEILPPVTWHFNVQDYFFNP